MGFPPYLLGWRGNPLMALLRANLLYGVAAGVGTLFARLAAGSIRHRLYLVR